MFGHQSLVTLCLGKSFFSSINFPFESIKRATSGFSIPSVGVEGSSECDVREVSDVRGGFWLC